MPVQTLAMIRDIVSFALRPAVVFLSTGVHDSLKVRMHVLVMSVLAFWIYSWQVL